MKVAFIVAALLIAVAAAALVPLYPYLDFQVLFHANMGLRQGIALYDHASQVAMIADIAAVPAEQVYVLPFPYPPWYALSTIWLAWLPVGMAVRAWFGLNLLMLIASSALLTSGLSNLKRALLALAAVFWLPTLGSLFVGQYGFPVLLGAALMVHALRRENPFLVGLAAALLTFKPHLGLVILLIVALHVWVRRDRTSRNTLIAMASAGALLFGLGFAASPRWPAEYLRSLMGFQSVHGVPECTQCVSLPVIIAGVGGGGLETAAWIALALAALACGLLIWRWKVITASPHDLVSAGALVTLLVTPYALNYDYLLLLVPFMALAREARSAGKWIALGIAYILPPAAIVLLGAAGNASLIASTVILAMLFFRDRQGDNASAPA